MKKYFRHLEAIRAKLGRGGHLLPTGRAGGAQPGPTLFAKLRLRAMRMLTVWTLHQAVLLSAAPAAAALGPVVGHSLKGLHDAIWAGRTTAEPEDALPLGSGA